MKLEITKRVANRVGELLGPAEIAQELKVPTAEAIRHVFIAIGEGLIRESDLFFILTKKYNEEATYLDRCSNLSPQKLRHMLRINYFDDKIQDSKAYDLDELVLYASYLKAASLCRGHVFIFNRIRANAPARSQMRSDAKIWRKRIGMVESWSS